MTDDHAAFRRAIADNPRDLLARLVYADYLEETGDPNHVIAPPDSANCLSIKRPSGDANEAEAKPPRKER